MKCQDCGYENKKGVNFCERCGIRIFSVANSTENYASSRRKSVFGNLEIMLGWLAIGGGIIFFLWIIITLF